MRIKTWNWALLGLMAITGAGRAASAVSEEDTGVRVRILNRAGAGSREIARASREAQRILQQAGVPSKFIDCTPDELGYMPEGPCQLAAGPADLVLRIVHRPHHPPM